MLGTAALIAEVAGPRRRPGIRQPESGEGVNTYRPISILFSPLGDQNNSFAIARVADLARRNGARLSLLGVVPEPSRLHRLMHPAELDAAIESLHRHEMKRRLEDWSNDLEDVDVDIDVQSGNAALAVLGEVITAGHDLVVVTSDEDGEDRATIKRLLRKCPCPVWVIRPTGATAQRIVVAVDPEPTEAELNTTLLELAAGMFDLYGGELHLLHAWELFGEAAMRDTSFPSVTSERLDELLHSQREGRSRALDELVAASGVGDRPWQIHLVKGPATAVVPTFVRSHDINLLVMGTVARVGLAGAVMGNTAEQILDYVGCSVITAKPPDFVSPLGAHP
jgi:universal stress protein E